MIPDVILAVLLIAPQVAAIAWYWRRSRRALPPEVVEFRRRLVAAADDFPIEQDGDRP